MASSRCPQAAVNCADCDTSEKVTSACIQCNGYICSDCEQKHSEISSTHKIIPKHIFRRLNDFKNEHCKKHDTNDITVYCEDCRTPCCGHCLSNGHLDHNLTNFNEKLGFTVDLLEKYSLSLSTHILPAYRRMRDRVHVHMNTQGQDIKLSKYRITSKCTEIREHVNRLEKELLDLVEIIENNIADDTKRLDQQMDTNIVTITDLIEKCEKNCQSPNSNTIELFLKECVDLVNLQPTTVNCPTATKFISSEKDCNTEIQNLVGTLKEGAPVQIVPSNSDFIIADSFDIDYVPFTILPISTNKAWISGEKCPPTLYNCRGRKQAETSLSEKYFAITRSSEFIYSHRQEIRIVSHGKTSKLISTYPYVSKGICINENQHIAVCLVDEGRRKSFRDRDNLADLRGVVRIYSRDGMTKVLEISHSRLGRGNWSPRIVRSTESVNHESGDILFYSPERLVQNTNGDYVITDIGFNKVVAVDRNGCYKWNYAGSNTTPGQGNFHPQGIACDGYSRVIVTDKYCHKIHLIDSDGQIFTIIDSRNFNISSPFAIGIDLESNVWYLGTNDKHNHVYQIQYLRH